MGNSKTKPNAAALTLPNGAFSMQTILGDFDLFPESLFSHLSHEEQDNVKDLLLGVTLDETEIDLSGSES